MFSAVLVRDEEQRAAQVGARQQQEHLPGQEWWVLLFIFLFLLSAAPSLHYPIAPQGVFTAWVAPWCSILFICSSIRAYFVASATPLLTGFAQSCTGCFCRILQLEKHKMISLSPNQKKVQLLKTVKFFYDNYEGFSLFDCKGLFLGFRTQYD